MGYLDNTGLSHFWGKIKAALNLKQDALVSGTNIKTINNTSLLGSGNIDISGGSDVLFVAEYGTTTYAEITTALNANKLLFCYVSWNDIVCPYIGVVNSQYAFSNIGAGESTVALYVNSSNQWTYATSNLATQSAVNAKQDALVSGTNIKTVNNESLLGSGNISISGGGGKDPLVVYLTLSGSTYTADKTYTEIQTAAQNDRTVIVVDTSTANQNEYYYLAETEPYWGFPYEFRNIEGSSYRKFTLDIIDDEEYWSRNTMGLASLISPTFTGTPKAPTAAAGTNTTQIATTAFVQNALGDVWTLSGGTAIPSNADLNDYTTQGNYYSNLNTTARTVLNTPWGTAASSSAMAFILKVVKPTTGEGTNMYVRQELYPYKSTAKYVRYTAVDSATTVSWQPWVQILTTDGQAARAQYLSNYYHDGTGGTRPTTANIPSDNRAGLRKFIATSSMTEGRPGDGHIIHMDWDNSARWAAQIWVNNSGTLMATRGQTGASTAANGGWNDWTYMATQTWVTTQIADAIGSAISASY